MGKPATECVSADSPASHPPWCPGSAEVQGRTATGCCIALHLFIVQSQFMATFCTCLGHGRLLLLYYYYYYCCIVQGIFLFVFVFFLCIIQCEISFNVLTMRTKLVLLIKLLEQRKVYSSGLEHDTATFGDTMSFEGE